MGGPGGGPRGGVTMLEHYQAVISNGAWHHVQLYVVSRQAVQVLDNVTVSATLPSTIRTGWLVVILENVKLGFIC